MTIRSNAELAAQATQIRDETTPRANTATRVGTMLVDLVDSKINVALMRTGILEARCVIFNAAALVGSSEWSLDTSGAAQDVPGDLAEGDSVLVAINNGLARNGLYVLGAIDPETLLAPLSIHPLWDGSMQRVVILDDDFLFEGTTWRPASSFVYGTDSPNVYPEEYFITDLILSSGAKTFTPVFYRGTNAYAHIAAVIPYNATDTRAWRVYSASKGTHEYDGSITVEALKADGTRNTADTSLLTARIVNFASTSWNAGA